MKTIQSQIAMPRLAAAAVALVTGSLLLPGAASANTAANATIRNTVTVNYADAGNTQQAPVTDEVDVTIQLVAATPTLNAPGNQTIAPSSTATYNYTVSSNANGPDSYTLGTSVGTQTNLAGSTASTTPAIPITLGATTVAVAPGLIAANTPTAITVPSDQSNPLTPDNIVNGIAALDVVVIGGVRCDVTAVTDSGTAATGAITNSTITVDCDAAVTPLVGAVIGEQRSFTMTVDPNGWTAPNGGSVIVTTSAGDTANVAADATDDTTTFVEQLIVVTKYVRCAAGACTNPGAPDYTLGVTDYYTAGVSGAPGATLEYLIVIENPTATNTATDVVISDPIPAFTTLVGGSLAVLDNSGASIGVTDATADNGNQAEVVGSTIYLYPGDDVLTMGDDNDTSVPQGNTNGDGGSIGPGNVAYGRFQVTIQ